MQRCWLVLMFVVATAQASPAPRPPAKDAYRLTVSRVVAADGQVAAADVDAALRAAGGLSACAAAPTPVVAWLAFEQGKVALADVGGTDDRAIRACLVAALRRASLANRKQRVVAIVELTPSAPTDDALAAEAARFAGLLTSDGGETRHTELGDQIASVAARSARLEIARAEAVGTSSLTASAVATKIQAAYHAGIKRCFREYLKKDPSARGEIALSFTVNAAGRTTEPAVHGIASDVEDCTRELVKGWRFPVPKDAGGAPTSASFKITFTATPD
jgi:hypothetical protein